MGYVSPSHAGQPMDQRIDGSSPNGQNISGLSRHRTPQPGAPPQHLVQQQQRQVAAHNGAANSMSAAAKQATGPSGANIFVFNFPRSFEDKDLEAAFAPFGNILSATVFIDKATSKSKCFGFVSYDSVESAQEAINKMNGATLGGKVVKVQIKRERSARSDNPQDHGA
mmetsp:Transcript_22571/g.36351  ORF Transcript_22571/g.36351 Transcript_22571/m.36351 type:complete len:168 (-) Transcript_22571:164-667(-)